MPWTAGYNAALRAVEVVSQGSVSPEDFRRQIQQAAQLGRDHQTGRFFMDAEHVTNTFSAIDLISLVDAHAGLGFPQHARMAVLLPACPRSAPTVQFYETAARNRAYNVRAFPGRAAAELWLMME